MADSGAVHIDIQEDTGHQGDSEEKPIVQEKKSGYGSIVEQVGRVFSVT